MFFIICRTTSLLQITSLYFSTYLVRDKNWQIYTSRKKEKYILVDIYISKYIYILIFDILPKVLYFSELKLH